MGTTVQQKGCKQFAKNTLAGAVCEIRFIPSPDSEWNPARPAPLYKEFMDAFPLLEPINEAEIEIVTTPQGVVQNVKSTSTRIQFKSEDEKKIVQVSDRLFSYNEKNCYTNWDSMKYGILSNWKTVHKLLQPIGIARIGLRYTNRIPRTEKHPMVGDWLRKTEYIPESILKSKSQFLCRVEARENDNELSIVTLSDAKENDDSFTSYDIDMIIINPKPENTENLEALIENLHTRVENAFLDAHTDLFRHYLDGGDTNER